MKVRVDCDGGTWRVFVEMTSGLYRELAPSSCEFSHIDIDTAPPKDGFILSFVKRPEAVPNLNWVAGERRHERMDGMKTAEDYENGYYWLIAEGEDPEVVQISNGALWRIGSDARARLESWLDDGAPDVVVGALSEMLKPPNVKLTGGRDDATTNS